MDVLKLTGYDDKSVVIVMRNVAMFHANEEGGSVILFSVGITKDKVLHSHVKQTPKEIYKTLMDTKILTCTAYDDLPVYVVLANMIQADHNGEGGSVVLFNTKVNERTVLFQHVKETVDEIYNEISTPATVH